MALTQQLVSGPGACRKFTLSLKGRIAHEDAEAHVNTMKEALTDGELAAVIQTAVIKEFREDGSEDASPDARIFHILCTYRSRTFQ